jgi:predicted AAA+ superfamily ATPase
MIKRVLEDRIKERFYQGKIVVITGPRQSGKTTLMKSIAQNSGRDYLWLNMDEADLRKAFEEPTSTKIGSNHRKSRTGNS